MEQVFERAIGDLVPSEQLITCTAETSISDVIAKMRAQKSGSIVVVRERLVEGIFTERDVMNKIDLSVDQTTTPVSMHMVKNPICLFPTDPVRKAMVLMRVGRFRNLPIVNNDKELMFVLSLRDIVDYVADSFSLKR